MTLREKVGGLGVRILKKVSSIVISVSKFDRKLLCENVREGGCAGGKNSQWSALDLFYMVNSVAS